MILCMLNKAKQKLWTMVEGQAWQNQVFVLILQFLLPQNNGLQIFVSKLQTMKVITLWATHYCIIKEQKQIAIAKGIYAVILGLCST